MDSWDPSGGFDWSSLTGAGDPGGGSTPVDTSAPDTSTYQPMQPLQSTDPSTIYQMMQQQSPQDTSGMLQQLDTQSGGQFTKLAKQFGILDKNGDVNWLALASALGPASDFKRLAN